MNNLPAPPSGYRDAIVRAAQDPGFNLEKFERLVAMQQEDEQRIGDRLFNEALSRAQRKMTVISANANNVQTRSQYATYARLDGAIREDYTAEGFSVSFNTEPTGEPNSLRVVGMLSMGIISRRYQMDVPVDTTGIKGTAMMTRTHAAMSAFSYGKRNLLIAMFNLAIGDDDDGNAASGRAPRPTPQPGPNLNQGAVNQADEQFDITDGDTGEVIRSNEEAKVSPCKIKFDTSDDWRTWGKKLMWGVRRADSVEEVDQWVKINKVTLDRFEEQKPAIRKTLQLAIDAVKEALVQA